MYWKTSLYITQYLQDRPLYIIHSDIMSLFYLNEKMLETNTKSASLRLCWPLKELFTRKLYNAEEKRNICNLLLRKKQKRKEPTLNKMHFQVKWHVEQFIRVLGFHFTSTHSFLLANCFLWRHAVITFGWSRNTCNIFQPLKQSLQFGQSKTVIIDWLRLVYFIHGTMMISRH